MSSVRPTKSEDHVLVGERVRIHYRPVEQDLVDQSMSFGDEETVEVEVTAASDVSARGEADDGRMVSFPLKKSGRQSVRARSADRDTGAYRQHLGMRSRVVRVEDGGSDD